MNIQGWFPLGLTGFISLSSQGLSRVFVVVQSLSHFNLCVTPWTSDAARLFCPPWSPWICSNLCPLNWWCYLTISSSAAHFSFCLIYFPVFSQWKIINEKFQLQQPKLPMNIQGWFPLGLTSLISLQFKGFSRVFSNTTVQKHQFFSHRLFHFE